MDRLWNSVVDVGVELGEILGAVLFLVIVMLLARFASRWLRRRVEATLATGTFGRNGAVLLGRVVAIVTYLGAFIAALASLGVSWTGLLTFLGAGTVALGLSLQDVLKNFFSGIFLLMERPFRIGDHIRVRDIEGEVQGIDVRTTLVKVRDGSVVMVPNAIVFTEILTNRSRSGTRRIDLVVTAEGLSGPAAERQVHQALAELQRVFRPISAPIVTSATSTETVLSISLLIEDSADAEREAIDALLASGENGAIKVARS